MNVSYAITRIANIIEPYFHHSLPTFINYRKCEALLKDFFVWVKL
jgi:hypothetical protein